MDELNRFINQIKKNSHTQAHIKNTNMCVSLDAFICSCVYEYLYQPIHVSLSLLLNNVYH